MTNVFTVSMHYKLQGNTQTRGNKKTTSKSVYSINASRNIGENRDSDQEVMKKCSQDKEELC